MTRLRIKGVEAKGGRAQLGTRMIKGEGGGGLSGKTHIRIEEGWQVRTPGLRMGGVGPEEVQHASPKC